MIGAITPFVEADKKKTYFSATLFLLGTTLGATSAGLLFGSAGWLLHWIFYANRSFVASPLLLILIFFVTLTGCMDLGLIKRRLPQPYCQVPREWIRVYGIYRTAFSWGLNIGAGIRTIYTYNLYYVLIVTALIVGSPLFGFVLFGCFGFTYGMVTAISIVLCEGQRYRNFFDSHFPTKFLFARIAGIAQIVAALLLLQGWK